MMFDKNTDLYCNREDAGCLVKKNSLKIDGKIYFFFCLAAVNAMRLSMIEKYKCDDFQFSQPYLFFWVCIALECDY